MSAVTATGMPSRQRLSGRLLASVMALALVMLLMPATLDSTRGIGAQDGAGSEASARAQAGKADQDTAAALEQAALEATRVQRELLARLDTVDADEVLDFLQRYQGSVVAEPVRDQWLRRLVREQRWADYLQAHVDNGSRERDCWYRRALLGTDQAAAAFSGLSGIYLTGGSLPSDCDPLFAVWAQTGGLRSARVWERIGLALEADNPGVAAFQARYLPAEHEPWLELMLAVHQRPARLLEEPITAERVPDRAVRQRILIYGLERLAAQRPRQAEQLWASIAAAERLPASLAERADIAVGKALAGAGDRRGLDYLARLQPGTDNQDLQHERLRIALRLRAWQQLADWSEGLVAEADELAKWRYWRGKALMRVASGAADRAAAAHAFAAAAEERTLWGFAAAELIGRAPALGHRPVDVDQAMLDRLMYSELLQRFKEMDRLGRVSELRRDWHALVRLLPREQQLALAAAAAELGLTNQSILALSRAAYWDDLELRFPLAYADLVAAAAAEQGLPPDWVYAVIRQESAFDPDIASHAGAIGLMQLMPPTAREVARKVGYAEPERLNLTDPAPNVALGTAYLAEMQQRFDGHPLLASAAYNAGPTAVTRWLPDGSMPGDLWLTEIPYAETRQYVRRVLTYRVFYRDRLGLPPLRVGAMLRRVH
ncbi:lytic transglycosylase domain-containing protein [Halochromatium sp.]